MILIFSGHLSCKSSTHSEDSIRLIHLYKKEYLQGQPVIEKSKPAAWHFKNISSNSEPTGGWESFSGISNLKIENGFLKGTTSNNLGVIHLKRTEYDQNDLFHSLEVRLRVSAGEKISFACSAQENPTQKEILDYKTAFSWDSKNIAAGQNFQTVVLTSPFTIPSKNTRNIFIQPTDIAGATFEIESIRLILRKDHLASIPTGVSWQGLSGIFQESLVMHSPAKLSIPVELPEHPMLEVNLGTVESYPITFTVFIERNGITREKKLLEKTLTTAHRWDRNRIDLSEFAGETAKIRLALASDKKGTFGIWGNPVIRNVKQENEAEKPQGVILIWTDTLRRDHLNIYGYPRDTTPHLKKMAEEGVVFNDAISQATWTKVSTPSMMTSLYPITNGVHEFYDRLPSSATTMAEVFYDSGYATLNYTGVLFTGKFTNLHQGFEEVNEDVSLSDLGSSKTSREYIDRLLPWLESHRAVPFFVFLHLYDPHDPYKPRPPYDTMWADPSYDKKHEKETEKVLEVMTHPLMKLFHMPNEVELNKAGIDPKKYVQHNKDLYDGAIRGMDAEIGRLIERLRDLGLEKKTLIVFASDHGEEFLDHGATFHGQSVYGELTNVGLVFWAPEYIPKRKIVKETVENLDVMPTILELCGLKGPKEMQGQSMMPLMLHNQNEKVAEASTWKSHSAISERANTGGSNGDPPPLNYEAYSIISGQWKLVHHVVRNGSQPEFELFDRDSDLLDQKNVADQHPDIVKRLSKDLQLWKQKAASVKLKPDSDSTANMSPEEIERLRSLGYIQ
jgi:arylsulfatase A-like enzyme